MTTTMIGRTFGAESWRRLAYGVVSAPVGLAALVLVAAGRPGRAGALQRRVASTLLGGAAGPPTRDRPLATVAYALLCVPFGLVGLWLAVMVVPDTVRNLLFGVFTDGSYALSWGGPTLAGAWAVHAAGGLLLVPVGLWLACGLTALQRLLADALLGGGRVAAGAGVGTVAVLVGSAVFLTAWAHQV